MKIEIKTSHNSIKLLSADEVFVKMCRELIEYSENMKCVVVENRKSAIGFLKNYEKRFIVHQEETTSFSIEIKMSFPKLRSLYSRIIKSKLMSQVRKVVAVVTKEVFIKLMVEIILSLIHGNDRETEHKMSCLALSA